MFLEYYKETDRLKQIQKGGHRVRSQVKGHTEQTPVFNYQMLMMSYSRKG